ncbi:MAG: transcription antitermination factor NusB [Candidatus Woesebacteria bacterium]
MKTSKDPRHQQRIQLVKALFTYSFSSEGTEEIADIVAKLPAIDELIKGVAKDHPLQDINKIDLAILRLGVFELEKKELSPNIIIDEAIEIAKEYGAENSKNFVNAVLSKIASQNL